MTEDNKNAKKQCDIHGVMPLLPFQIESICVVNTGLQDYEVENIDWIDAERIEISNYVDCVYDDGLGGTCISSVNEFDWAFKEKDFLNNAYVLILLKQ